MSDTIPSGYDWHVVALADHAGLTCRFLKPADFTIAELPPETPDFSDGATFMPLAVAMTSYGPMVFTVAARPAFDDGAVSQWLEFICDKEGYPHSEITETRIGALPAVTCDATQQATDGTAMRMRFVLLEDGGRIFQMSAMAPDALWSAVIEKMTPMLASFELRESRGTQVQLLPGVPLPTPPTENISPESLPTEAASAASPAPAAEPSATMTPEEFIALALAEDAASLDPEHPVNANLRNRGVGFVPRIVSTDAETRCAVLAASAVEGFLRVPFGWHVNDDGRRTLVFDAGGRIQISLNQRAHEGASEAECARHLIQPHLENEPGLPHIEHSMGGIAAAGVRGVNVEGAVLDQFFLVRDLGREGRHLVARVTATAEDMKRALDLAGDIMATFRKAEDEALP